MFQSRPTYFHGSLFAPGLALFSKYRFERKPFTISNRYKGITIKRFFYFLIIISATVKPCWNHLTSNLGLLNVRCGAPFPRTRLSTNKRDYPGLLEKQIKRSADSSCQNCLDIKLNSAEILGAASLSSGPTSDPDPGEPKPGGKDGQLLLQVFG